jgi:aldehyde dehydrogenase (NAD+)
MTDLVAARGPYVDGKLVDGDDGTFTVFDPATEEMVADVEASSVAQVDAAIDAARRAFDDGPWPRMSMAERADVLYAFAGALVNRRDVILETIVAEAGSPRRFGEAAQVGMGLAGARELVDLAVALPEWEHNELPLREYVAGGTVKVSIRQYEPVGVVAAITPSNFPFTTNVWKLVPALITGCTAVLRPSPATPLSATVLAEAADAVGMPPGVLNVVLEEGSAGAERLSTHPGVDLVTFTGSSAVGAAIAAQAAPGLKRVILELGGKSVQWYLADALADGPGPAVAGALAVFAAHCGQGCSLQTRMLVPREREAEVLDAVGAAAAALPIGDPRDAGTVVGPLVSEASRTRVESLVAAGVADGGRIVAGGERPDHMPRGWFYRPTVVSVDSNANPLAQTEVFGPVLTVQGYGDIDEAIGITNDSPYDLSAGLYTRDLALGTELAARIRTGTVQVNVGAAGSYTPMGGYKQSGVGRERGVLGIRAFQQAKHFVVGPLG